MKRNKFTAKLAAIALMISAIPSLPATISTDIPASAYNIFTYQYHESIDKEMQTHDGQIDNFHYIKYPDHAEIFRCDVDETVNRIEIPATIEGVPVTSLSSQVFRNCPQLKEIVLPETVTDFTKDTFGDSKWYKEQKLNAKDHCVIINQVMVDAVGLHNEKELIIPDGVKRISKDVLYDCGASSLERIVIPDSVERIDEHAFNNCHSVQEVVMPETLTDIRYGAFKDSIWESSDLVNGCKVVNGVLIYAEPAKHVDIPDGVKIIGEGSFDYCDEFESVTMPDSVTQICNAAFNHASNISEITLSKNLESIGLAAFAYTKIEELHLPASLRSCVGGLENMYHLKAITMDEDNPVFCVQDGVLFDKDMETLIMYPFSREDTTYIVPPTVKYLENSAFSTLYLQKVVLPEGLLGIGQYCFFLSSELNELIVPNSVEYIGENAFDGLPKVTRVSISSSADTIEKYAYFGCSSLTDVEIPEGVTTVKDAAFGCCKSLQTIHLSSTVSDFSPTAAVSSGITGYTVDENNPYYSAVDGLLLSKDGTVLCAYPYGRTDETFTIPASVKVIAPEVFNENENLKNVICSEGLEEIGDNAFNTSEIESITISDTVQKLGDSAFYLCRNLKSITIPKNVTEIGDFCFSQCASLKEVVIAANIKSLDLKNTFKYTMSITDFTVLNDDCALENLSEFAQELEQPMTIHGNEGSEAQKEAEQANISFELCPKHLTALEYVAGDVNGDGTLGVDDVILLLRYVNEDNGLDCSQVNLDVADCDGKEGLTAEDANWIIKKIAKID